VSNSRRFAQAERQKRLVQCEQEMAVLQETSWALMHSHAQPAQIMACQDTVSRTFGFTVLGFFAFGGFAAAGFVADFTFLTFGLSPAAAFGLDTYASGKGKIWQQQSVMVRDGVPSSPC